MHAQRWPNFKIGLVDMSSIILPLVWNVRLTPSCVPVGQTLINDREGSIPGTCTRA
jgi:hypothetical protein